MKRLLFLILLLAFEQPINAQNAHVQLIHAIADTNLSTIDLWLFETKIADNISFREATGYISIPTAIESEIRICDSSSVDTLNPIFLFRDNFIANENYVLIATGIHDQSSGYSNFKPIDFTRLDGINPTSQNQGYTDVTFFHSVTDLDTAFITETRELLTVIEPTLGYSEFSITHELESSNYRMRIQEMSNAFPNGEFEAFLASNNLEDSSIVLLVSGFKNPALNNNGKSLGLHAITSSGIVYSLEPSQSKIQFLHNSADPGIASLDIYVNGVLKINSLDFQSGTGYLSFPSGEALEITLTDDSASSSQESLFSKTVVLDAEKEYVAPISGVNGSLFDPIEPLDINLKASRIDALTASSTDILFFNASTDAGEVSIFENTAFNANMFSNLGFNAFSNYLSVPTTNYKVDLLSNLSNEKISTHVLNLSNYDIAGKAITLMTSGFLDTTSNGNGEPLGLWFAMPSSGKFIKLEAPAGIQGASAEMINLFPNPAFEVVTIESSHSIKEVSIFNIQGQLVRTVNPRNSVAKLSVKDLPRGVYAVMVSSEKGNSQHKLIVN